MAASMISFFCRQLCRNSRSKLSVLSSFYRCKNGQNVSAVPKIALMNSTNPVAVKQSIQSVVTLFLIRMTSHKICKTSSMKWQRSRDLFQMSLRRSPIGPRNSAPSSCTTTPSWPRRQGPSLKQTKMIVVATSAINNCLYCIISHSALFRIYFKNPTLADQVAANWECAELSPRQHAIVEFAVAICKSETITEEHFKKLEAHLGHRGDRLVLCHVQSHGSSYKHETQQRVLFNGKDTQGEKIETRT